MARLFLLLALAMLFPTGTYHVSSYSTVTPIEHIIIIMQENHFSSVHVKLKSAKLPKKDK